MYLLEFYLLSLSSWALTRSRSLWVMLSADPLVRNLMVAFFEFL